MEKLHLRFVLGCIVVLLWGLVACHTEQQLEIVVSVTRPSATQTAVSAPSIIPLPTATSTIVTPAPPSPEPSITPSPTLTLPPTPTPTPSTPILFMRDKDLWQADLNGEFQAPLTDNDLLAQWVDSDSSGDPWWVGGFPPRPFVSPDGRWIALTQNGQNLVLIDVTKHEPNRTIDISGYVQQFVWSPDSAQLAFSAGNGLYLYHLNENRSSRLLSDTAQTLAWSPDGQQLAYSCCFSNEISADGFYEGEIKILSIASGELTTVSSTQMSIASTPPDICWMEGDTVVSVESFNMRWKDGIAQYFGNICSQSLQRFPIAFHPTGTIIASLILNSSEDAEYFNLLKIEPADDPTILFELETPMRYLAWSPWSPSIGGGNVIILGNGSLDAPDNVQIWRYSLAETNTFELLIDDAFFIGIVPQW
ncbi:MAG: PD40 domain-containing protein, partial [Anaerolineales bacterium]|nr:PD40 domain-containing protein [Anaerolineales bacterium]